MAGQKREMTISEEMEINWNDQRYSENDEKMFIREFEIGWNYLIKRYAEEGKTQLSFDPMKLVV